MDVVHQLVLLLHLVGFAALFGGVLVQARSAAPEINPAMLHGALTQLVSGLVLVVLDVVGDDPVHWARTSVKLGVSLIVVVLVVVNRKFVSIPRGVWGLIGGLTLADAAVAVLWT